MHEYVRRSNIWMSIYGASNIYINIYGASDVCMSICAAYNICMNIYGASNICMDIYRACNICTNMNRGPMFQKKVNSIFHEQPRIGVIRLVYHAISRSVMLVEHDAQFLSRLFFVLQLIPASDRAHQQLLLN